MKRVLIVIAAASMSVALPGLASASPYSGAPDVSVDDTTPTPGQTIVVSLSGFLPGETVTVTVNPTYTVTANSSGSASLSIPAPTALGTFTVTGTGVTSGRTDSVTITVVAATGGGGGLPATGSESSEMLQLAFGAAALGAGLVGVTVIRRRRPANA
jgi:LPXTG-motif cell wall-anchored protein